MWNIILIASKTGISRRIMKWITAATEHIRDRNKEKEMEGGGARGWDNKSREEKVKAGKQRTCIKKKEQIESLCLDRSTNSIFCIRQFQTPLFMYLGVVYGYTQTNTIINLSARALGNPHIKSWVIDLSLMVSAWGSKSKYN